MYNSHMITLTPYNPDWPKQYDEERQWLAQHLDDVIADIQHIGSTAIPGIHAKPVIDILIGVHDLNQFNYKHIEILEQHGYQYIEKFEVDLPFRRYFEKNNAQGQRTHQIHLVNHHSAWWTRHLLFRDYMRRYPATMKEYEAVKLSLAPEFDSTLDYAHAKTSYVESINRYAFHDWTIHKPFTQTETLNGYIVQPACLDNFVSMHHNAYFVDCYGVTLPKETVNNVLLKDIDHWDQYQFGPLAWFEKTANQFAGKGGLRHIELLGNPETELAYALMPGFWGQGLAKQIGHYALNLAFNQLQLDNVICFTASNNKQSLRVIEKLGFTYEKTFEHSGIQHKLHRLRQSTYLNAHSTTTD